MKSVENQETTKCMICGHQELINNHTATKVQLLIRNSALENLPVKNQACWSKKSKISLHLLILLTPLAHFTSAISRMKLFRVCWTNFTISSFLFISFFAFKVSAIIVKLWYVLWTFKRGYVEAQNRRELFFSKMAIHGQNRIFFSNFITNNLLLVIRHYLILCQSQNFGLSYKNGPKLSILGQK